MGYVKKFMDADHAYLECLIEKFLAETNNHETAFQLFTDFRDHLLRHMQLENEFLFPRFDKYLGIEGESGPTIVAKRDHANLIKLLDEVILADYQNNIGRLRRMSEHVFQALKKHKTREQEVQYPLSDSFIGEEEMRQKLKEVYGDELNRSHYRDCGLDFSDF